MESSFTLFRVRGIPIGANWSWLFVFAFLVWSLASDLFPRTYPGLGGNTYLAMAIVGGILFVASLLLHELGHALRALREGMEIEGITLWFFGGVARFKGMFPSAGAEFRIAIAGPIVSVLLAVAFGVVTWFLNLAEAPAAIVGVTFNLARINTILFAFNMIPALPLDGGRVLRSYLWWRQKNFMSATLSAARVARLIAGFLIAFGVFEFLTTGADLSGLWFAFIGWFLLQAAQAEAAFARLRQTLRGLHVRDIMTPQPEFVPSGMSIRSFIDDVAHLRGHSTYPVIDGDRLAGLVSLRLAAAVPPEERGMKTVRDVMVPLDEVPVVDPDAEIVDAMATIRPGPGRAIVVDDGRVAGIVSTSDIARALETERLRAPAAVGDLRPRRRPGTWITFVVIALVGFGLLFRPPIYVIAPGQAFDVSSDISISGIKTDKVHGKYLLTSVAVGQPTGIGLLLAIFQSRDLVPASSIVPRGVDQEEFFRDQERLFRQTQQIAAAAAARAAGLNVRVGGPGARVIGIVPRSPAARELREGDVITAIEGKPIRKVDDVGRAIRDRPTGTRFKLTVQRDGRTINVTVPSASRVSEAGPGIGVYLDIDTKLPFKVTFRKREIGGPSAGLAYALAVYDMLKSADVANGRIVATTGMIDLDGRVGAVGGIEEKAVAAKRAGAKIFLVPTAEVEGARGSGLDVHGVSTLKDAIDVLRA